MNEIKNYNYRGFNVKYIYDNTNPDSIIYICVGLDTISGDYLYHNFYEVLNNNYEMRFKVKDEILNNSLYWITIFMKLIDMNKCDFEVKKFCDTLAELLE